MTLCLVKEGSMNSNREQEPITVHLDSDLYHVLLEHLPGLRTIVLSPQDAYALFQALRAQQQQLKRMLTWEPCYLCGGGHPRSMSKCPIVYPLDQEG